MQRLYHLAILSSKWHSRNCFIPESIGFQLVLSRFIWLVSQGMSKLKDNIIDLSVFGFFFVSVSRIKINANLCLSTCHVFSFKHNNDFISIFRKNNKLIFRLHFFLLINVFFVSFFQILNNNKY